MLLIIQMGNGGTDIQNEIIFFYKSIKNIELLNSFIGTQTRKF